MIDRDQLTEALAEWEQVLGPNLDLLPESTRRVVEAARAWRDFPTDEQVEAAYAEQARLWATNRDGRAVVRGVLEAVRQVMIGEET